ncbi:MAG TPA: hypothetical protein VHT52_23790, partial [Stellaceae bacterium]|nr:hypothetical protein [Stellaceae bacterium]
NHHETKMTMPSDLALTIINEGEGYSMRCEIGERALTRDHALHWSAAAAWMAIALEGAKKYQRRFGEPGSVCFTARDILTAAGELADYYENHAREARAAQ